MTSWLLQQSLKKRGNKLATASVECRVADRVVSSANLMFSIMDGKDAR